MFKSKFACWDDVIAVDYTCSTESVLKKLTIQRVSWWEGFSKFAGWDDIAVDYTALPWQKEPTDIIDYWR